MRIFGIVKSNSMGAWFKKNYVHFVAIGIFLIASMVFYRPALQGLIPQMHDITTHRSSSKELVDYKNISGESSLWTSRTFSGMPAYQIMNDYPKAIPKFLLHVLTLWLPYPINMMFLLMLSLYILFMCLKVDPWLALIGSLCFGFFSHFLNIMGAGHTSKTHAMAYMPAILGTFYAVFTRKNYLRYGIAFALFLSLQLFANHYQITYYTIILLSIVGVFLFVSGLKKESAVVQVKKIGLLGVGAILAFMISSPSIILTNDFAKQTIRGKSELTINKSGTSIDQDDPNKSEGLPRDYITEYSYDKGELMSHLIPNSIETEDHQDWMEQMQRKHQGEFSALYQAYQANADTLRRNSGIFVGNYFGDQTSARPHYIGALMFFLAILGLIYAKGWVRWGLFSASILAVLLSLGQNLGGSIENMWLTNFFIDYVPMYNKFRAVKMILVIVEISIPVLAMLGLNQILKDREQANKQKRGFIIAAGAMVLFLLANVAKPDLVASFFSTNEEMVIAGYGDKLMMENPTEFQLFDSGTEMVREKRVAGYMSDAWRALLFVVFGAGILLLYFLKVIQRQVVIPAIGLLLLIDTVGIASRFSKNEQDRRGEYVMWMNKDDLNNRAVVPSKADYDILALESAKIPDFAARKNQITKKLKDKGLIDGIADKKLAEFTTLNFNSNFRVFNLGNSFNDGHTPFLHKATGGYNAAKLKKFQEIIEFRLSGEKRNLMDPSGTKVMNMLNTQYFYAPDNPQTPQDESQMGANPFAFGNAWLVQDLHKVVNADEEILAINDVDVSTTAIIQEKYLSKVPDFKYDSSGTITQEVLDYKPNHLIYKFSANADQFVVFSEIYYADGWNAYIDDQPAEHVAVNYILRGLHVPAGEHTIEFKFEPNKAATLSAVASIGGWLLILVLVGGVFSLYRDVKNPKQLNDNS